MSPASSFMVGGLAPCGTGADVGTVCAGVRASYPYIPAGFGYDTLLVAGAGDGVAAAAMRWGDILLARYGRTRKQVWEAD